MLQNPEGKLCQPKITDLQTINQLWGQNKDTHGQAKSQ